jgi:hypothetical protein
MDKGNVWQENCLLVTSTVNSKTLLKEINSLGILEKTNASLSSHVMAGFPTLFLREESYRFIISLGHSLYNFDLQSHTQ